MTSLTIREQRKRWPVSKDEIMDYIKRKHLVATTKVIQRVRRKLRAAKVKDTLGSEFSHTFSTDEWQVIYGRSRVGGTISCIETGPGNGFANGSLHMIITLAGHEIDEVEELWLDNERVVFGADPDPRWSVEFYNPDRDRTTPADHRVFLAVNNGNPANPAIPDAITNIPNGRWTSAHRQRGCAHVYLILIWDPVLFPNGVPEIEFVVRGKKVYDPRSSTTAWSENAALCIADYLTDTRVGCKQPIGVINMVDTLTGNLEAAADICDQTITLVSGTEPRYRINGSFTVAESKLSVLEQMVAATAGMIVYSGGAWNFFPAAYRAPAITLTQDDIIGEFEVETKRSRRDSFNGMRGKFMAADRDYTEQEFPFYKNSTYVSQDGVEEWEEVEYQFVTTDTQCQRLAKIEVERARQSIVVTADFGLRALNLMPGDTVQFTYARFGWTNKVFEVQETQLTVAEDGGGGLASYVRVVMQETASAIFDWNNGEQITFDPAPNTTLPDPNYTPVPTGLTLESGTDHLYIKSDGTVISRLYAYWDAISDAFVSGGGGIDVQYKKTADSLWLPLTILPGSSTNYYITDVQDGVAYDVRIRTRSPVGLLSFFETETNHTVLGKSAPPSDVTVFSGTKLGFGIRFDWDEITDFDRDLYELRVGDPMDPANWDAADLIAQVRGNRYTWDFKTAGTYTIHIKAIDTSGNYSVNSDQISLVISAPGTPIVSNQINGANLILSWDAPVATDFAIAEYEIRYGASYAGGTTIAVITGLNYEFPVAWGGNRTFWVAARDVAQNTGVAGSTTRNILNPNPPVSFNPSVQINTVLLDWEAPTVTSLPIARYNVYKGPTFALASSIGTVGGTFSTYLEEVAGLTRYWIEAEDTAGNLSTPVDASLNISVPEAFVIRDDIELGPYYKSSFHAIFGGTFYARSAAPGTVYLPIDSTQVDSLSLPIPIQWSNEQFDTWEGHFDPTYGSMQDLIDAGYTHYLQPTTTDPGHVEYEVDYQVVIGGSFLDFTWESETLGEPTQITPSISYSEDGVMWTTVPNASQIFASDFRYVRYRLDFEGLSDKSLTKLSNIRARLSVQTEEEYGEVAVFAADTDPDPELNGTFIAFQKDYLDVYSIQFVSVSSVGLPNDSIVAVKVFQDVPDPAGFRVLLFDIDGNRIDGTISYRAIGAVNVE